MRVAAIDLGTNSFLCLIVEKQNQQLRVISDEVEIVRLGQGMATAKTKAFHPEALLRAQKCLEKFADRIDLLNVTQVKAVATSAARDAINQDELFQLTEKYKIPLQVISGAEEARLTFKGAMLDHDEQQSMVIDIGGGSTEFLYIENASLIGKSLDIGGVRLTEKWLTTEVPSESQLLALREHIQEQLHSLPFQKTNKKLVAVAGTPTTLASMYLGLREFREEKIHNLRLRLEDIEALLQKMMIPLESRKQLVGLDPKRADIMIAATIILIEAMRFLEKTEITVSTKGIRYGLATELLQ